MILGGAQENTMLSILGQRKREGYEVILITGPTNGPEGSIVPLLEAEGVKIIELKELQREVSPFNDFKAYRRLRKIFQAMRPDVVHTHSSKAGVVGRLAARKERVPKIIHTIHGLPFHPYQSNVKNFIYILAERLAAQCCHKIVSVADAMTDQALAAGIGQEHQYITVYSGMETEEFLKRDWDVKLLREKWNIPEGAFVIGKVARLFEFKGHEYLFEAFGQLIKDHENAHLFLIGDGIWRQKFEDYLVSKGLREKVTFAGLVSREKIPEVIALTDMIVHCSLREGLARVLPQALLSGKPVVSFDVDGAREVVINNKTGHLIPPKDISSLVCSIEDIIINYDKAKGMAESGTQLCKGLFDWKNMSEQLCAIYENRL
jgi:glycosyltransferase involved in cell wall biosynthesis